MDMGAGRTTDERKGSALEVVRDLLAEGRTDAVLAAVAELVEKNGELATKNGELARRLAQLLSSRGRSNEGVGAGQLKLFIATLARESDAPGEDERELTAANAELRTASGID